MSRVAFPLVLQSPVTGSALVGAKATITKHNVGGGLGSGEAATIYTTETESTTTGINVITTDNTGRWTQGEKASPAYAQYWIPEGRYDILISGPGLSSVYITRELVAGAPGPWVNLELPAAVEAMFAGQIPAARREDGGNRLGFRGAVQVKAGKSVALNAVLFTVPSSLLEGVNEKRFLATNAQLEGTGTTLPVALVLEESGKVEYFTGATLAEKYRVFLDTLSTPVT
jgi:hypothetical protein